MQDLQSFLQVTQNAQTAIAALATGIKSLGVIEEQLAETGRQLDERRVKLDVVAESQRKTADEMHARSLALSEREKAVDARERSQATLVKDLALARAQTKGARDDEKKYRDKFEAEREKYNVSQNLLGQVRLVAPYLFRADGTVKSKAELAALAEATLENSKTPAAATL